MNRVELLAAVLLGRQDTPAVKRLRIRVRELGDNARDEVAQFELLRKACREDRELAAAIIAAGLPDLSVSGSVITPELGPVVQAFNDVIEEVWSRRASIPGIARRPSTKP